ncbi:hypothetical protein E2C01_060309 [Portunus trituberculatus]|uniref:Uncharacterized protein n=1 Tax=Portunus trituberculatus TaxID=210409 RepID=A0A5B7H7N9_PORTR|nr:hypothetical protein [Portunus trituberculatus]
MMFTAADCLTHIPPLDSRSVSAAQSWEGRRRPVIQEHFAGILPAWLVYLGNTAATSYTAVAPTESDPHSSSLCYLIIPLTAATDTTITTTTTTITCNIALPLEIVEEKRRSVALVIQSAANTVHTKLPTLSWIEERQHLIRTSGDDRPSPWLD